MSKEPGFRQFIQNIDEFKDSVKDAGTKEITLFGEKIEVKLVNGQIALRSPKHKNEYNPEGLTLNLIGLEIFDATYDLLRTDWDGLNSWLREKAFGTKHYNPDFTCIDNNHISEDSKIRESDVIMARQQEGHLPTIARNIDCLDPSSVLVIKERKMLPLQKEHSLKYITGTIIGEFTRPRGSVIIKALDGSFTSEEYINPTKEFDEQLVALIKEVPVSLQASSIVRDAWARWSYAANWGELPSDRKTAAGYLEGIYPKLDGRAGDLGLIGIQFLQAYKDFGKYVKCLKKYKHKFSINEKEVRDRIKEYKNPDDYPDQAKHLLLFFPECCRLDGLVITREGRDVTLFFYEMLHPAINLLVPGKLAEAYFADFFNVSKKQIKRRHKEIKKLRMDDST